MIHAVSPQVRREIILLPTTCKPNVRHHPLRTFRPGSYETAAARADAVKLIEVLRHDDLAKDEEATIYVALPWSPDADAIVISPGPTAASPLERDGRVFHYFLEGFLAQEFLEDLVASGDFQGASERQLCERLIEYAQTDA